MNDRHISQRMCLFLIYGTFNILVLMFLFVYIYRFNRDYILREASARQANICASVRDSVSTELDNMSTISLNLVYSNVIRKNFSSFADNTASDSQSRDAIVLSHENAKAIYDIITAIIGPFQSAAQVNLYTMDGACVGSGYQQSIYHADLKALPWYQEVIARDGSKFISVPEVNLRLPATGANQNAHRFLSMARLFFNEKMDAPEGIFEVVQDCHTVFSMATEMEQTNKGLRLFIYNDREEQVYPYAEASYGVSYLNYIQKYALACGQSRMLEIPGENHQLITCATLPEYEWTVVAVESENSVYLALSEFRASFFLLAAAVMLGALAVCFFLAKQMTNPLCKLTKAAKGLTLDRVLGADGNELATVNSIITEIDGLCNSFLNMYERLRISSRNLLLARSEEIRANFQATQSLVNPHFLYNSLASIEALAEEGEDAVIMRMCNALCDYFRYIADGSRACVTLRDELECTGKYIECMQIRFGEALDYSCRIESDAGDILIPKLIIQPLVENAFKYAFNSAPPWRLRLSAVIDREFWRVRVEDNGGCLSEKKRLEILRQLHHMDLAEELHNIKIGGMGIKNVYLRLLLLYRDKAFFDIQNVQPGVTAFLIGGPVRMNKEEIYGDAASL